MISLANIAPPDRQISLLDVAPIWNCDSNASARNAYGNAAQEIVWKTLSLNPIRINGNFEICFDAEKDGVYYEIKSVKRNGKLVIYDWRIKKESSSGVPLFYAILIHNLKGCREDILTNMRLATVEILVCEAVHIHELSKNFTLNKLNKGDCNRSGYNRKGYIDGYYNIPVNKLREFPHQTFKP